MRDYVLSGGWAVTPLGSTSLLGEEATCDGNTEARHDPCNDGTSRTATLLFHDFSHARQYCLSYSLETAFQTSPPQHAEVLCRIGYNGTRVAKGEEHRSFDFEEVIERSLDLKAEHEQG